VNSFYRGIKKKVNEKLLTVYWVVDRENLKAISFPIANKLIIIVDCQNCWMSLKFGEKNVHSHISKTENCTLAANIILNMPTNSAIKFRNETWKIVRSKKTYSSRTISLKCWRQRPQNMTEKFSKQNESQTKYNT